MRNLSTSEIEIVRGFERAVALERVTSADVVERLKEIGRRRIYLKLGHDSLFIYLVKGLKFPKATAQRRIDAARILDRAPEVKRDLETGALNLTQMAMMAQSVRQSAKEKATPVSVEKQKELIQEIKGKDVEQTQKILAQSLDIEPKVLEKKRFQKDSSMRLETTIQPHQSEVIERAKNLLSHKHPNPTMSELFEILAKYFIEHEDPVLKKPKSRFKKEAANASREPVSKMEVAKISGKPSSKMETKRPTAAARRQTFQKFDCCQWINPSTGEICGSRFQRQTDHIIPLWAGGSNEPENLQVLCSAHNRHKYRMEAGLSYS